MFYPFVNGVSWTFLSNLCKKEPVFRKKTGSFGLLIPVLQSGVLVHTAEKQFAAAELQQLTAFLFMEGHDSAVGIDPDTPQGFIGRLFLHKERLLSHTYFKAEFSVLPDKTILWSVLFHGS
jgi:hypothetical protein